jgi:ABC-type glycerol-3-phosphate transport system substrate-binding protein
MSFSEEQLKEVEEMAGLFFAPEDIAVNLEFDEDNTEGFVAAVIFKDTTNPLVSAYLRGWMTAEVALRKAIKQSALNGSSPSQQAMLNYQKEARK